MKSQLPDMIITDELTGADIPVFQKKLEMLARTFCDGAGPIPGLAFELALKQTRQEHRAGDPVFVSTPLAVL